MKKVLFGFLVFIVCTMVWKPVPVYGETNTIIVDYFYISVCASCHDTEDYLKELSDKCASQITAKNMKLAIYKHNTAEEENLNLLKQYFEAYQVPKDEQNLPIVFVGKTYISGDKNIKSRLAQELPDAAPGSLVRKEENSGRNAVLDDFNGLKLLSSFSVGFVNGLTPCSLSMLLFFISLLIARNVSIIRMGLLYCAGKFITYFLLGTLLFKTLGSINAGWVETAVKVVMLAAIAFFVIFNALDFLAAKDERYEKIRLQLPARLRGLNHRWIKGVSQIDTPAALAGFSFVLGMATSIGEFLCTGQIYLTTILYVLHSQTALNAKALLYFLEYNLAFVTPLLIITFVLHKGKGILDVSEFIRKRMHLIKLINIIIFLAFGVFLLFSL